MTLLPRKLIPLLVFIAMLASCGNKNGEATEPVVPYTDPAVPLTDPGAPAETTAPAEAPVAAKPTLPPKPEGAACVDWKPSKPLDDAKNLLGEVANQGLGALQQVSCSAAAVDPLPCDIETCEAWVSYLSYDALVLYQKFELDSALDQALVAVKTGRDCGLTGQTMSRAYVGLGFLLADTKNEMFTASSAFKWAFLHKWSVALPFPSPPPMVKMTYQSSKNTMGSTEFSCVK